MHSPVKITFKEKVAFLHFRWFKSFREECPNGRLSKAHLHSLFKRIFPSGDSEIFCNHIFRIFDSDGNQFLDFKGALTQEETFCNHLCNVYVWMGLSRISDGPRRDALEEWEGKAGMGLQVGKHLIRLSCINISGGVGTHIRRFTIDLFKVAPWSEWGLRGLTAWSNLW